MFTFQFLNDKIHNYVKKKLSKTNTVISRFERTRGEKTQIFRTTEPFERKFWLDMLYLMLLSCGDP